MTYRTNTAPVPATRPALTRWQRAVVAMLGDARCARFAWFRAHVGGRWAVVCGVWMDVNECPGARDGLPPWSGHIASLPTWSAAVELVNEHRRGCSCEVYPWPSLYTRQTPEEARSFEEFRRWYEGVRVVDLSRAGKVTR